MSVSAQNGISDFAFKEEDTSRIKITRLSISSGNSDFSPYLSDNTLIFASGRDYRVGVVYYSKSSRELTDLYFSYKKDSVNFKEAKPFPHSINSKFSEGPASLNQEGTKMFFSGNSKKNPKISGLKIYVSNNNGKKWRSPSVLPFCDDKYNYCHPVLMSDQKTLIFASDMAGGFGGMDLYATTFENGTWLPPRNLGKHINTSANETFPFVTKNDILYFSSDRKNGAGGLDIYQTDMKIQESVVKHLESPINSKSDDFGIWTDSLGESGYFSSDRMQTGDDLFYFNVEYPDFSACPVPKIKDRFCYTFFEEATTENRDTVAMTYEWNFGDGYKARALEAKHCFPGPGTYQIQLNIVDKSSGEVFENHLSYELEIEKPKRLIIDCPDTVYVGDPILINGENSGLKGYTLEKQYWSLGDGKYNEGKKIKHVYKNKGEFTIEMGVKARNETTNRIERFRVEKRVFVRSRI